MLPGPHIFSNTLLTPLRFNEEPAPVVAVGGAVDGAVGDAVDGAIGVADGVGVGMGVGVGVMFWFDVAAAYIAISF